MEKEKVFWEADGLMEELSEVVIFVGDDESEEEVEDEMELDEEHDVGLT